MVKNILKILMLFLINGEMISGCADVDYTQYFNYYYINNTKYDFNKVTVYQSADSAEYSLMCGETLKISYSWNDRIIPIVLDDIITDSLRIYYDDTIKKIYSGKFHFITEKCWDYYSNVYGKHNEINDYYYIFDDVYFE